VCGRRASIGANDDRGACGADGELTLPDHFTSKVLGTIRHSGNYEPGAIVGGQQDLKVADTR
jgi:hypothetical protein